MPRGVKEVNIAIDQFAKRLGLAVETVQRMTAFEVHTRLVKGTPVDTGRARGSWTVNVNDANRAVLPEKKPGSAPYPAPNFPELSLKPGESVWISNNLPYIGPLEEGHSGQAPNGWILVSIQEVRQRLRAIERAAAQRAGLL